MIIDAHTHMFHGQYLDQLVDAGGNWAKENIAWLKTRTQSKPHFTDIAKRLEELEQDGFAMMAVTPEVKLTNYFLPVDPASQLAYARVLNDTMARIMEDSKGRLLAGASIPLESFEQGGRQEMERAIKTLGLKVINVPAHLIEKPVDLPEFEPFWAQVAEMDVSVWMPNHPAMKTDRIWEAGYDIMRYFGRPYTTAVALCRLVFSGIMERYPTLRILGHHLGGGMIPFYWGRIDESYAYPYESADKQPVLSDLPKPPFDYFSLFYYDTAVGDHVPAVRCAYEMFGADRLVFATDAPWGPGAGENRLATYPKVIESLGLSEAENKKIFEDNARKLLKLA